MEKGMIVLAMAAVFAFLGALCGMPFHHPISGAAIGATVHIWLPPVLWTIKKIFGGWIYGLLERWWAWWGFN